MAELTIVSNRLPVSVQKINGKLEFGRGIGGVATGLASYMNDPRNKWIGWPGVASDELTKRERKEIAQELQKQNCYPVFLTRKQVDGFYNGYSNRFLWPLLHDLPLSASALPKESEYWDVYQDVNKLYAREVLRLSTPENHIWVHDYQLMLLPALLRAERPQESIGFFLHIPVPTFGSFRKLRHGKKLVEGVLGSDLVGLQTPGYSRNFLGLVKGYRIAKIDDPTVRFKERAIRVTEFPIGIDYAKWKNGGRVKAVRRQYAKLKAKYGRRRIIISADRLDPTKGIPQRLRAYRTFLEKHPELHRKVQYVVLAAPSRTDIEEYKQLDQTVEKLVADINTRFGTPRWQPIDYYHETWGFEQLRALYQLADVGLFTPLRDGMNLMVKEFLASKSGPGVLVLSQTAGAAEELHEAILVNPRDEGSIVQALEQALTTPKVGFKKPLRSMQRIISKSTIHTWATGFIDSLQMTTAPTYRRPYAVGLTAKRRDAVVAAYRTALRRLVLVDYDGTLVPFAMKPEDARPPLPIKRTLASLATAPTTEVVVVSGRSPENLEEWLGDTGAHLVAEHGAFAHKNVKQWQQVHSKVAKGWQEKILPVLEHYATETPGAHVEQKNTALVWHYRQAKPYYAQKNLVTLKRILRPIAKTLGLEMQQGNMILEFKPADINKGTVVSRWLKSSPDFVLIIGDDYTDEDMFRVAPKDAFTIKVGSGPTTARFRVKSIDAVLSLLERL